MKKELNKFEQRKELEMKRKAQLQKMKNAKIKPSTRNHLIAALVCVVIVLIVCVILFFEAGFVRRMLTAVTVGDETATTAEFNYYYTQQASGTINMYRQYFGDSYVPFDTTKKLSEQDYGDGQTWEDYFIEQAEEQMHQVKAEAQAARAEGMELTAEDHQSLEATMTNLAAAAANNNMTLDRYLTRVYGLGVNEELFRQIQEEILLAQRYDEDIYYRPEYTEEQLQAYYDDKGKDSYSYVDMHVYTFASREADEEQGIEEVTAEDAEAQADKVITGVNSEADYSQNLLNVLAESAEEGAEVTDTSLRTQVTKSTLDGLDTVVGEWAFDEARQAGDCGKLTSEDGTSFYVVYMVTTAYRNDYNSADIREIFFQVEDMEDEEAVEAAKAKAEDALAEWQNGEATEDSFAALADEISDADAEGGLLQKCGKSGDEISDWVFDEARQSGDVTTMMGSSGYYVIYYKGQNVPYWQAQVESAIRSEDYEKAQEDQKNQYPITRNDFGIGMKSEPKFY